MTIYAFHIDCRFINGTSHNSNVSQEIRGPQGNVDKDPNLVRYGAIYTVNRSLVNAEKKITFFLPRL